MWLRGLLLPGRADHGNGMSDYRLDEVEKPERHPDAVKRLTEPPRRTVSSTGGELPGRKMDGRR